MHGIESMLDAQRAVDRDETAGTSDGVKAESGKVKSNPFDGLLDAIRPKPESTERVAVTMLCTLSDLGTRLNAAYPHPPHRPEEVEALSELGLALATARKKAKQLIVAQR